MKKIEYEEHQRDYTLLGNSATFTFCVSKEIGDYFGYKSKPMYVCRKDGFFYHYYATVDSRSRAESWYKKYDIKELVKKQSELVDILKKIKTFYDSDHSNSLTSIIKIYDGYRLILPFSLLATEVPEHNIVTKEFLDICFSMRKKMEFVFKTGESLGKKLIKTAERDIGLKPGTLENLTYREFCLYSDNNVLPKNTEKRRDFVLVRIEEKKDFVFYDKEKLKQINLPKVNKTDFVKGVSASRGIVAGVVKIMKTLDDAKKINKGDILVASMTDPRYMSAMQKASAFVTDEGGITCHAAIVARELKKPCIIGTKVATKIFADGDIVEVNADIGLVTLVK
jgi:phosphohistidine swiveling domain-containing protein